MKSLLDNLNYLSSSEEKTTTQIIAKELYDCFLNRKFLEIGELAEKCFVSKSTITGFCKKLGYSGYREFLLRLKIITEHYTSKTRTNLTNKLERLLDQQDRTVNIIKDFAKYNDDFIKISKILNQTKKLYIFSAFQLDGVADSFSDIISPRIENVIFNRIKLYSLTHLNNVKKDDVIFFFVSGQDTKSLDYLYENAIEKTNNIIVLASDSHFPKFHKYLSKINIDTNKLPRTPNIRIMILNYIIMQIMLNLDD